MENVLDASPAHGILFGRALPWYTAPVRRFSGRRPLSPMRTIPRGDYQGRCRHMVHRGRRSATAEPECYGCYLSSVLTTVQLVVISYSKIELFVDLVMGWLKEQIENYRSSFCVRICVRKMFQNLLKLNKIRKIVGN
jgi:hypothetical protein